MLTKKFPLLGYVKSFEDHGVSVSFGVSEFEGIIPMKNVKKAKRELSVGELVETIVDKTNAGTKIAFVSIQSSKVAKAVVKSSELNADAIKPGMMFKCVVEEVLQTGVKVTFMGLFKGTIHINQIPHHGADWQEKYRVGSLISARVIRVDATTESTVVAFSVMPHCLKLKVPDVKASVGGKFKAKLVREDAGRGIMFKLISAMSATEGGDDESDDEETDSEEETSEEEDMEVDGEVEESESEEEQEDEEEEDSDDEDDDDEALGYAYVTLDNIADEKIDKLPKRLVAGSKTLHTVRVVSISHFDAMPMATIRPSLLSADIVAFEELKPGMRITCTVKKFISAGVILSLNSKLDGFCESMMLSDYKLRDPKLKFRIGQRVPCRVLRTNPEHRRVYLTAKRSLVKETPMVTSMEEAEGLIGQVVTGFVLNILDAGVVVCFYNGVCGFISAKYLKKQGIKIKKEFKTGQTVKCGINSVDLEGPNIMLKYGGKVESSSVTMKASDIPKGAAVKGRISAINNGFLVVKLESAVCEGKTLNAKGTARIDMLDISNDIDVVQNPASKFKKGDEISAVISRSGKNGIALRMEGGADIVPGERVCGRVNFGAKHVPKSLDITLPLGEHGRVSLTHSADPVSWQDQPFKMDKIYANKDIVSVYVVNKAPNGVFNCSLRESLTETETKCDIEEIVDAETTSMQAGKVVKGFIKSVSEKTVFVELTPKLTAIVYAGELDDAFVKNARDIYTEGQLVTGKLLSVHADTLRATMSLKASVVSGKSLDWSNMKNGMVVEGKVFAVKDFGVLVRINGSSLRGLCHRNSLSDDKIVKIDKHFSQGDSVKALIKSFDEAKKRIELSMKASELANADVEESSSEEEDSEEEESTSLMKKLMSKKMAEDSSDEEESEEEGSEEEESESGSEEEESEEEGSEEEESESGSEEEEEDSDDEEDEKEEPMALDVSGGFDWMLAGQNDESEDEEEEETTHTTDSKTRRANKRKEESRIRAREDELASGKAEPQSEVDYERLILETPHDSMLWIRFMAHYAGMGEITKARAVSERALKMIPIGNEAERKNIWTAKLNLAYKHGDSEMLQSELKSAVASNEPKGMYLQMLNILEKDGEFQQAKELCDGTLVKKFKSSCKIWIRTLRLRLSMGGTSEDLKTVMKRAITCLPKRKHIKAMQKFASLHYKYGNNEKGRSYFEDLVAKNPKRVDLWNVYVDQEIKTRELDTIRQLFERLVNMKFSSKKMKHWFKRYLDFENQFGDESTQKHVKLLALAYVQRERQ
eukprot:TRINITY_DN95_c2_g3_i1.p1 TRINITY_DN95_c2_g3~~TRINITY_DN95_c2_g3_i1.p1  ORF type:complete len:1447 (+),score=576.80 TRINITY_DN95_c2_g3_i1:517-4341(+)